VPEFLDAPINTASSETCPFIAPDGSYLLFSGRGREDGRGNGDIYVRFWLSRWERWSEALPLPAGINTGASELCPVVTPDGRFLFFTSSRGDGT
jgi:Tol biopolymer transport system component